VQLVRRESRCQRTGHERKRVTRSTAASFQQTRRQAITELVASAVDGIASENVTVGRRRYTAVPSSHGAARWIAKFFDSDAELQRQRLRRHWSRSSAQRSHEQACMWTTID